MIRLVIRANGTAPTNKIQSVTPRNANGSPIPRKYVIRQEIINHEMKVIHLSAAERVSCRLQFGQAKLFSPGLRITLPASNFVPHSGHLKNTGFIISSSPDLRTLRTYYPKNRSR